MNPFLAGAERNGGGFARAANSPPMLAKASAIALTLGAALADSGGAHQAAFYLLLGAVPAAALAALVTLGDLIEAGRPVRGIAVVQALLGIAAAGFVVVTTAARSTGLLTGQVPRVAVSALVACLGIYALQGVLALLADLRPSARPRVERQPAADRPLRRAA
jgi:hypothetical protein